MIGDVEDMRRRLRLTLPGRWFGDVAPVLDGVLGGFSAAWASLYDLLTFVAAQCRVGTAVAQFLDLASTDYFGGLFRRRAGEADTSFRARLKAAMRRERGTRASLVDAASAAGFSVTIFEPANPGDTGTYNLASGLAWNVGGAWGSLEMPFECLITAQRGAGSQDAELWQEIGRAMPAGGVAWLRIQ